MKVNGRGGEHGRGLFDTVCDIRYNRAPIHSFLQRNLNKLVGCGWMSFTAVGDSISAVWTAHLATEAQQQQSKRAYRSYPLAGKPPFLTRHESKKKKDYPTEGGN